MATKNLRSEKITSPEFRVSFPNVFVAKASLDDKGQPTGKSKYSLVMLIPKTTDTMEIRSEISRLAIGYFGEKRIVDGKKTKAIPKAIKNPLKDGDEIYENNPEKYTMYKGMWSLTASSLDRPGLVDHNLEPIITPNEFYAGCYARCTFNLYTYDLPMSKGIALGLQNIQKLRDGESFSGTKISAENDFDAVGGAGSKDALSDFFEG